MHNIQDKTQKCTKILCNEQRWNFLHYRTQNDNNNNIHLHKSQIYLGIIITK